MGPHGVLVGATGSGKSELLRSLVAGPRRHARPRARSSFVLVDYKGGAAFAELSRLPHVAGIDHQPAARPARSSTACATRCSASRSAASDAARRRQRRRHPSPTTRSREERPRARADARPARRSSTSSRELLPARPEFIDLFVGLGRVGRWLGIHLLFSSQRLDEGRLRGLESHLRYRLCLRTYSAIESKVVLGTPDAYLLPSLPGPGLPEGRHERSTSSSGPRSSPARRPARRAPIAPARRRPGLLARRRRPRRRRPAATDRRARAGRRPSSTCSSTGWPGRRRRLRPPGLGAAAARASLARRRRAPGRRSGPSTPTTAACASPSGCIDLPAEQRTAPLELDLAGAAGNVAVVGAPRTGKSTLLRSLLVGCARDHTPEAVRVYGDRPRRRRPARRRGAPHVGGVASASSTARRCADGPPVRGLVEEREEIFRRLAAPRPPTARPPRARRAGRAAARRVPGRRRRACSSASSRASTRARGIAAAGLAFGDPPGRQRQPLGRDPPGAARQPRLAPRAAPQRPDRLGDRPQAPGRHCPPTCPAAA